MKVCLVEPVLLEHVSMRQYADTFEAALRLVPGGVPYRTERLRLAPPDWTRRLRGKARTAVTYLAQGRQAFRALRASGADLCHILDGSRASLARWAPAAATATVHDLIPLLQARGELGGAAVGAPARWLIRRNRKHLQSMAGIFADSENTRRDLARTAGVPSGIVTVVPPSLSARYLAGLAAGRSPRVRDSFILHLGNNAFYKNRSGVLRIFSLVPRATGIRLVMAGPTPTPALRSLVRELGLEQVVQFVVKPNQDEIVNLYERAALLLFPSLYEGFGWPPLEAMACGCPVVASNRASLPEVVGDAGLLGDPDDHQQMSALCFSVLSDKDLAHSLVEKGLVRARLFTPQAMGVAVDAFFRSTLRIPASRALAS